MSAGETALMLHGLRCAGCVRSVEGALRETAGVLEATVNYTTHRALVRFDPSAVAVDDLVGTVSGLGYSATAYDPDSVDRPASYAARAALVRVLVAGFLAGNVMWIAAALYIGEIEGVDLAVRRTLRWLAIALSVPAVTWCAAPFWQGAVAGLRRRELTIDVPIAIGIGTSFLVSILGTVAESPSLFMDSAAVIVFLILLGRTLERSARAKAASAVDTLNALTPETAWRWTPDGFRQVRVDSLRPGDRVRIAPGQRVPTDGWIRRGTTELDEALLTGESVPVARGVGHSITGGTANLLAEIEVEVSAPATGGTLARLAALLERAQTMRPAVQQLADRVAAVFAPTVLIVAGLTAVFWIVAGASALDVALTAASVLIVACPCALGLATPAAVTAAIGRAAQLGIVVKSGTALEQCARADAIVLDKTGTLTAAQLAVEDTRTSPGFERDEVLIAAARAEGGSTHPLARAVRAAAPPMFQEHEDAPGHRVRPGLGVEAEVDGRWVRVGSRALLDEAGIAACSVLDDAAAKWASQGLSLAWVSLDDQAAGVLAVSDPPRADARVAVERIRASGAVVHLVSGDHADSVALAAHRAGIESASAAVTPDEKVRWVENQRQTARAVVAVGDGINDAAALAAADVGVAMGHGADVTLDAADVVIRAPRLGAVADLLDLSRSAVARIRENLGFAVAYNAVAVPLAAGGWLDPLHAAIAMSLSSLVVTGNAVRLLRWRARS